MNVASLELCKELYELSGWLPDCRWYSQSNNEFNAEQPVEFLKDVAVYDNVGQYPYLDKELCPAYDAGYLLRKLPTRMAVTLDLMGDGSVLLSAYWGQDESFTPINSDTIENALCLLAIELHNQNILPRKDK